MYLKNIINIADVCFELGYWPSHFKTLSSIIITKPNKKLYNSPKMFKPIVLHNTIGKLIEKVISERLQFHVISNNFIHLSQLGGLKQYSLSNTGITLIHFICTSWVKNNYMSTLTFDIAQFFPSLNHQLLPLIFNKMRFNPKVLLFFHNYLISRKPNIFGIISPLLFSMLTLGLDRSQLSPLFYLFYIFLLFFIFLKIS